MSQKNQNLTSLEAQLSVAKLELAKANSQLAKTYANIDILQSHLRDARNHPLKQLRRKIEFKILRFLAKFYASLPPRRAERFLRSVNKRDPNRNSLMKPFALLPVKNLEAATGPPKDFDPTWYLETYPDVAGSLCDPLEHYLNFGEAEGRRTNATHLSTEITDSRLNTLKTPAKADEIVLFVTFAPEGRIKPHVPVYLDALKQVGLSTVLIVAADNPDAVKTSDLVDKVDGLFIRQNGGFDFAAWAHVARQIDLSGARLVCLANDSLVGPFTVERLRGIMARVRESDAHLVGLTNSVQMKDHLQSYFLVAKGRGVQALLEFLGTVRMLEDKWQVIFSHEIQVSDFVQSKGLRTEALFPSFVERNRSVHQWRELIEEGFPFVKMEVIRNPRTQGWKSLLRANGYDAEVAEESVNLIRSSVADEAKGG